MRIFFIRLFHSIFHHGLGMEEFIQNAISGLADIYWLFYGTETNPKILQKFWRVTLELGMFLISAVSHLLNDISSGGRWTRSWWTSLHGGGSKVCWCWWYGNTALFFSPQRSTGPLTPAQALLAGSAMISAPNNYGIIWYRVRFKQWPRLRLLYIAHRHTGKNLPSVLWRELEGNISLS